MHFLTWDSAIIAALGLLLSYSLLIRKHRALATLVSLYIGYLMATVWGDRVVEFFAGDRVFLNQVWIKSNASPFAIDSILMLLVAFLLSSFIKLGGRRSRYSVLEVSVYASCSLAVAVMFMLSFMTPPMRDHVLASSRIVPYIYQWREWVLVVPIFAIIIFGIQGNEHD